MDASFVTTQGTTVHYDCVVKLHRLEETTEYERPSVTRQVRRSQRVKLKREREPKSSEEREPTNKGVEGEETTEYESPSVTRQVRRSQRVKLKREREPKSSEEREPTNKTVKGERTRKDVERIQVAAKGADSNRRSKEACSSGHQHLSEYELKRLENIKQNKSFLCFLELPQVLEALRTKPKSSQRIIKKVKAVEVLPHRKSLRLQSKGLSETSAAGPVRKIRACKPAEHVQVNPINMDENSRLPEGLLKLWTEDYIKEDQHLPDLNSLLVAAGDSMGHLGLWTLGRDWGEDGVLLFEPHSRSISCLAFSSAQPTNLLTVSNDGSARSMDLERALFEEVYHSVSGLKSFDFLSVDCSTLLIAHNGGDVVIVDRRTRGISYESLHTLDPHIVRGVHVHPLERQYFVAVESRYVHIYDCRLLKRKVSSPVCTLMEHSNSISGAFFSPCTGNRMLTSCTTGTIRVFNTSSLVTDPPVISSVKKMMQVSQYDRPKAVWDPKQEDCFVMGNIDTWPRQIQVCHESGQLLYSFQHEELMTALCPITAFHPNRHAILAATKGGRLHVFSSPQ
ncbi:WD repeat-containing protein 76 isoform X2 [Brachyhypopomus gauderio]|uniref:WD repeat-containing protein 76 isoform X2 n=1 Tax=Brachyhypopomus gauderio TaxID=698409 RepID=UPI004040FA65